MPEKCECLVKFSGCLTPSRVGWLSFSGCICKSGRSRNAEENIPVRKCVYKGFVEITQSSGIIYIKEQFISRKWRIVLFSFLSSSLPILIPYLHAEVRHSIKFSQAQYPLVYNFCLLRWRLTFSTSLALLRAPSRIKIIVQKYFKNLV